MSLVARAGNEAVLVNQYQSQADISITEHGSDFLWAIFCCMAATFLGISLHTFLRVPRGQRTFHYLAAAVCGTASIAYFSLASDLGETPITVEFIHGNWAHSGQGEGGYPTRQIWYARYIDWTITTPMLLLTLLLSSPVPLSTIFMTIFMDIVMIITGLIGALVVSAYKWGYFAFGCAALFWVYYVLFGPALKAAKDSGDNDIYRGYVSGAAILSFLWFLYPIAWGLCDGGNAIHPDSEMVFYGVLDLLAKPVFTIWHLYSLSKVPYEKFGFSGGKASIFTEPAAHLAAGTTTKNVNARHSDVTAAEHAQAHA